LSPKGEYLVSITSSDEDWLIIHKADTGEAVNFYYAPYDNWAVTKMAFNPSETIMYTLTWGHNDED